MARKDQGLDTDPRYDTLELESKNRKSLQGVDRYNDSREWKGVERPIEEREAKSL
ncbi:MAG: hypothetical protein JRH07_01230 [Deltaproteobacteria bacterium]|nr:hypothetical protein [Deltaproteobacteria bacterium]